jgi:hypothetical protein
LERFPRLFTFREVTNGAYQRRRRWSILNGSERATIKNATDRLSGTVVTRGAFDFQVSEEDFLMAFYHDPETGERIEVNKPLVRKDRESSWFDFIVVVAIVIGAGTLAYRYFDMYGDQQVAQSTIDRPVTTQTHP